MNAKEKLPTLTKALATEIAKIALGTAKGLELHPDYQCAPEKLYIMRLGHFQAEIRYSYYVPRAVAVSVEGDCSKAVMLFNPTTLREDFGASYQYHRLREQEKRKELEEMQ
jgi:hypothetical protein